jgi:predicted nuclease of restriction endonuclease-like (RecB) superfamily
MRQWFLFFSKGISIGQQLVAQLENEKGLQVVSQLHDSIGQQAVALITQVPWGHNITIITKCKSIDEALFYVNSIIENGWSRSVLNHQIESDLYKRKGKSISVSEYIVTKKLPNEFKSTLPTIKEIEDELKK